MLLKQLHVAVHVRVPKSVVIPLTNVVTVLPPADQYKLLILQHYLTLAPRADNQVMLAETYLNVVMINTLQYVQNVKMMMKLKFANNARVKINFVRIRPNVAELLPTVWFVANDLIVLAVRIIMQHYLRDAGKQVMTAMTLKNVVMITTLPFVPEKLADQDLGLANNAFEKVHLATT